MGRIGRGPTRFVLAPESANCPRLWDFYFVLKEPHPFKYGSKTTPFGNFDTQTGYSNLPAEAEHNGSALPISTHNVIRLRRKFATRACVSVE